MSLSSDQSVVQAITLSIKVFLYAKYDGSAQLGNTPIRRALPVRRSSTSRPKCIPKKLDMYTL